MPKRSPNCRSNDDDIPPLNVSPVTPRCQLAIPDRERLFLPFLSFRDLVPDKHNGEEGNAHKELWTIYSRNEHVGEPNYSVRCRHRRANQQDLDCRSRLFPCPSGQFKTYLHGLLTTCPTITLRSYLAFQFPPSRRRKDRPVASTRRSFTQTVRVRSPIIITAVKLSRKIAEKGLFPIPGATGDCTSDSTESYCLCRVYCAGVPPIILPRAAQKAFGLWGNQHDSTHRPQHHPATDP